MKRNLNGKGRRSTAVVAGLCLLAATALTGCSHTDLDGDWDPIKLSKTYLQFTAEGGTDEVWPTNYSGWWIEGAWYGDKQTAYDDRTYIYPTDHSQLEGEWFHVTVPMTSSNSSRAKTAIVTVDRNDTGKAREATLDMSVGDAFCTIPIKQAAE